MSKNEAIYEWFSTHHLFSISGMCTLIKVDAGNFSRYIAKRKIPEKYIEKVERIIRDYGYGK
jgi:hypothetical protein